MTKLSDRQIIVFKESGSFNIIQAIIEKINTPIENPIIRLGHVCPL